jgi:hypothetical protein
MICEWRRRIRASERGQPAETNYFTSRTGQGRSQALKLAIAFIDPKQLAKK